MITGFTGSLMVIAVNAWMNHPTGFQLHGGKVTDVNPLQALFGNPYLWSELIHMYVAAYMVTGFIVAGCYAFAKLRGNWSRYHRVALTIPLTIACLASPMQVLVGDWLARDVAVSQPVKLAAFEGLYPTTDGASEHILGWYTDDQVKYGIAIPHLLSLLAFHSWNAKIVGLQSVAADDRAPADQRRSASPSRSWCCSARRWPRSASSTCSSAGAGAASRTRHGSTAAWCSPARPRSSA